MSGQPAGGLAVRIHDAVEAETGPTFDTGGAVLTALGLVLLVHSILATDNDLWLAQPLAS